MNRRSVLKGGALLGVGAAGYAFWERNEAPADIVAGMSDAVGPPETETEIKRVNFPDPHQFETQPFETLIFYESGAAEIHFNYEHETNKFTVTHKSLNPLETPFKVWNSPDFEGPKVIGLQNVLENNSPYPSNEFTLGVYFEEAENFYMGNRESYFQAPRDWIDISGVEPMDS